MTWSLLEGGIETPVTVEVVEGGVAVPLVAVARKVWRQDEPPPAGTHYRWTGTPHQSTSEKVVDSEVVVNRITDPRFTTTWDGLGPFEWERDGDSIIVTGYAVLGTGNFLTPNFILVDDAIRFSAAYELENLGSQPITVRISTWNDSKYTYGTPLTPIAPGVSLRLVAPAADIPEGSLRIQPRLHASSYVGSKLRVSEPIVVLGDLPAYFDGDTPDDRADDLWIDTDDGDKRYAWDSTANGWALDVS